MSMISRLNDVFEQLLTNQRCESISNEQLISCIDLTLLKENASIESLQELKQQAQNHKIAAICVFKEQLPLFHNSKKLRLATVANFPGGAEGVDGSLRTIEQAIEQGAQEIDYVLPYQQYLTGDSKQALNKTSLITQYCKQHKLTLKIILETGAIPELSLIYQIARKLIDLGVDFLKTSTGKTHEGASLSAVFALLSAIKDSNINCGIKISGGVKTSNQAQCYARLASLVLTKPINKEWFRIGASSLLGELVKTN